jgi:hypothetical protein
MDPTRSGDEAWPHARHGPAGTAAAGAAPPSPPAISKREEEAFLRPVRPWIDPYHHPEPRHGSFLKARAGALVLAVGWRRPSDAIIGRE